ncbi:MAG TPA: hypothetical protein VGS01_03645 [Candidatus Limnocylindria bacterium]|nr:hypothetical protein [Candidatus Limnocylindria bacterium]
MLPLVTALVSGAFGIAVGLQYMRKRRPALLAWAIGLLLFTIAAFMGYLARSGGATEVEYRLFYLFGAITNVAWLALGTVFIVAPRYGRAALAVVLALSAVAVYAVFASPVDIAVAVDTGKGYPDGSLPRILAAIGSGVGSLVLIGGALWSAWVFFRRRHQGRRALANAIIAVGVFIVAAGGTVAFTGASGILELTNLIGVSVMFVGFLLA